MVTIKNFEMPKSCGECELSCFDKYGMLTCPLVGYVEEYDVDKNPDCPLEEVKA